ncbi:MAG TPA: HPF/RaiA family ribosome-associated protein [Polyangia bacterium]|nr:HPF/RaiA family ribosome-associated protein [Polyangia bacterium]
MQNPVEITFHHLPRSAALEERIDHEIRGLEKLFDRIVSCRVSIEAPPRHHHQGGVYRVRVELAVPGRHLIVDRSPDEDAAHADPYVAVRDAFRAAERQLEDHAKAVRGRAAFTRA